MLMPMCPDSMRVQASRVILSRRASLGRSDAEFASNLLVAVRDPQLFDAVVYTAGDSSASVPARIAAFIALSMIKGGSRSPRWEGFAGGLTRLGIPAEMCSMRISHPTSPAPLTFREATRMDSVKRRVYADTTAPDPVRSAAACM